MGRLTPRDKLASESHVNPHRLTRRLLLVWAAVEMDQADPGGLASFGSINPLATSFASYSCRLNGQSTRSLNSLVVNLHCLAICETRLSEMSLCPLPWDVLVRTGVFLPAWL